jgi:hypothetical protein
MAFDASHARTGQAVVEAIKQWRAEPIRHLVYTHGHADHVGGSRYFAADHPVVIGHENVAKRFDRYSYTNDWNLLINARQFGGIAGDLQLTMGSGDAVWLEALDAALARLRAFRPDALVVALGVLLQIVADSLNLLLVAQFMQGVGFGLARPGFSGGASLAVRPEEQGGLAGLVTGINGAGFVLSPLAGGLLYKTMGIHAPLWLAVGTLIAMGFFAFMSRRIRSTAGVSSPSGGQEPS